MLRLKDNELQINRNLLFSIIFILGLVAISYIAYAYTTVSTYNSIGATVYYRGNNSEFYTQSGFAINITTNASGASTPFNVSIYMNDTFITWLPNVTNNTSWNLSALPIWNATGPGVGNATGRIRNLRVRVNDTDGSLWDNSTFFYINERLAGNLSLNDFLLNNTVYNTTQFLNITSNETIANCTAFVNQTTSYVLVNHTGSRMLYMNSTVPVLPDSAFNRPWNVTYYCDDAFGNRTWMNTSNSVGFRHIKIDTVAPNVSREIPTVLNTTRSTDVSANQNISFAQNNTYYSFSNSNVINVTSAVNATGTDLLAGNFTITSSQIKITGTISANVTLNVSYVYRNFYNATPIQGNYINYTINVSDRNQNTFWVKIYHPNGQTETKTALNKSGDTENRWVEVNVSGTELIQNGIYWLESNAQDAVSRNGTGNNQTYLVTKLRANTWNMVNWNTNLTLLDIASGSNNISQIAIYDNMAGRKNFTVYRSGLSTNGGVFVNASLNLTLIYPTEDITIIRKNTSFTEHYNVNVTLTTGGWNFIGMLEAATLNQSMYADAYSNTSNSSGGVGPSATSGNITNAAWFNSTANRWCTAKRGFVRTTCDGFNVTSITVREDSGLAISVNQNMTMQRNKLV